MKVGAIDSSRIEAMISQLKAAATKAPGGVNPLAEIDKSASASKVNFSDALTAQLNAVNGAQKNAERLGQKFAMGDDSVSLSDTMIAGQKANIAFQATIQVRNKMVSAYQDIMNMQV
ncbi:MAG: flagellar hook-basal body complex protein FliE [Herminiimonas sp.]|nr:flagellar hook-basal body complex protein FliE [Herminiimonas sp.]